MKIKIIHSLLAISCLFGAVSAWSQETYEPLHGVTGYGYQVLGELELEYHSVVHFKTLDSKIERTYRIKSPVALWFNRNDLLFLKAEPKEFVGYMEYGGIFDIPDGGHRLEAENWMWADAHQKIWDQGEFGELHVQGNVDPVLKAQFTIPAYPETYQQGLDKLKFRVSIFGASHSRTPVQNVKVLYAHPDLQQTLSNEGASLFTEEQLAQLEQMDPQIAAEMRQGAQLMNETAQTMTPQMEINVGSGSFYGLDFTNELIAANLVEADKKVQDEFERKFDINYFRNMPQIPALPLINFLISPSGTYTVPINGSFSSNSDSGTETTTYQGTFRFFGDRVSKTD